MLLFILNIDLCFAIIVSQIINIITTTLVKDIILPTNDIIKFHDK